MKNEKGDKTIMKKVLLTSVLALSAIASVSYAATNGTPFNDATREFGNNTRFGARFNADKPAKPAKIAKVINNIIFYSFFIIFIFF